MTLTKAELAAHLVSILGLSRIEARDLVDLFFEEISAVLQSGKDVRLSAFGNFIVKDKSARPGRNPKTGEDKIISARRVVTFHAGGKLKELVDQYDQDQDEE